MIIVSSIVRQSMFIGSLKICVDTYVCVVLLQAQPFFLKLLSMPNVRFSAKHRVKPYSNV